MIFILRETRTTVREWACCITDTKGTALLFIFSLFLTTQFYCINLFLHSVCHSKQAIFIYLTPLLYTSLSYFIVDTISINQHQHIYHMYSLFYLTLIQVWSRLHGNGLITDSEYKASKVRSIQDYGRANISYFFDKEILVNIPLDRCLEIKY